MKFYNRTKEIEELRRIQGRAFDSRSRMTVITGRRRIGKTSLALRAMEKAREFDPFGHAGFDPFWHNKIAPLKVLAAGVNFILPQLLFQAFFALSLRILSPVSSMEWAEWTIRSRIASATVGSPTMSYQLDDGYCEVIMMDLRS